MESTRREFLRVAALGGVAVFLPSVFGACSNKDNNPTAPEPNADLVINLGNDTGVLNYAYALEQLEAAYYTQVVQAFSGSGLSVAEQAILTDIRNHEVIHRDFLAQALGTAKIPNLTPDFSSVNFRDRVSILRTAKTFEDIGVGAYNGSGKLLKDLNNLLVAGKIVSVEARHAAAIRDLLNPGSRDFAGDDIVDRTSGLDQALEPGQAVGSGEALGGAGLFIRESIRFVS
ncbi:MAG: ferritin-like domain-containing protein [Gemmatimonadaceae bacterium]|nr:ferritin-like domain-containing protein [Gemmatimonadaceae bacterium]